MTPYSFQRGETIVVMLQAPGAAPEDLAMVSSVTADLKLAIDGAFVPDQAAQVVATFEVVAAVSPSDLTTPPGWYLTIDADTSATMTPGVYVTNAVLALAGGAIEKTEALFIRVEQAT